MWNRDERIELLINRKLDGEISADEQLELDRALIRSPQHRRVLDESERIDQVCGEALAGALGGDPVVQAPSGNRVQTAHAGGYRRAWWMLPGAVAACLAWVAVTDSFGPSEPVDDLLVVQRTPMTVENTAESDRPEPIDIGLNGGSIRQVSSDPGVLDRRRDKEYITVIGEDGRLYLIEVDRLRTYQRASARSRALLSGGDL